MTHSQTTSFAYLCVCGQVVPLDEKTICPGCGRRIGGAPADASMTTSFSTGDTPSRRHSDQMTGQTLDHFTVVDRLGEGGMGSVYRALDESLLRYVALKIIRPSETGEVAGDRVGRLLEEARAQARVNHANVAHIYFVSRDPRRPYVAMELVPGGTLADRLHEGALPFGEVVELGSQIAAALRETSRYDIVHGDIKPSNILLHGSLAKLSDFGLARPMAQGMNRSRTTAGTPNYMSPESCRWEPSTARSDMYSFGVMLFEMTFGRLPYTFADEELATRFDAHLKREPEFPEPWPADVPAAWRPFLETLLAKRPEDRFANWDDLYAELRTLRPLKPVAAGRLQRAIAWGMDLVALLTAQVLILAVVYFVLRVAPSDLIAAIVGIPVMLTVPVFLTWWIRRGGQTFGKIMMQLRVVDRHGLPLDAGLLARRSIIEFLPIWLLPTLLGAETVGLPHPIWRPLWAVLGLFVLIDAAWALFESGRSLHDRFFGTRVVLEGAGEG